MKLEIFSSSNQRKFVEERFPLTKVALAQCGKYGILFAFKYFDKNSVKATKL